jgi:hypothetical protein
MAGETPKQTYRQPWSNVTGEVYADPFGRTYGNEGPMGRTPAQSGVWNAPDPSATPINANPAAMRNYTRYAGQEMEGALSSPDAIRSEIASLYDMVQKDPNDVVSQYRLRILSKALQDIYNVNQMPYSFPGPVTPGSQ